MILPRVDENGKPYLSYSQLSNFTRNKKEYIKQYFLGEEIQFKAYIDFGSKVGESLEKNDFSKFNEEEQDTLKKVIRLDEFEKEIRLDFNDFYIKGFIDTNSKDLSYIIDYKTGGLGKEEEYLKPTYIQPIIYALGLEQETGVIPEKAEVVFIERIGNAFKGEPLLVGNTIKHIPISLSKERLLYAKELIEKTAIEISRYYEIFLNLNK